MLFTTTHRAKSDFQGASLLMRDGENFIRVDVPRHVLITIDGPANQSPDRYLATLEKHRGQVEQIARTKYDAGHFHRYANSCVVPLTAADWRTYEPAGAGAAATARRPLMV